MEYGRVLMCAPEHFQINPLMGGQMDKVLTQKQWNKLKAHLEDAGIMVQTIQQVKGLPDDVLL